MRWTKGAVAIAMLLLVSGIAVASEGTNVSGSAASTVQSTAGAEVTAPNPDLVRAEARLNAIRDRAKRMATKQRETVEKQLSSTSASVDFEVAAAGEAAVRDRLSAEFGLAAEALAAQRTELDAGWGDLMIAHTLLANTKDHLTVEQLFGLRSEGLGWAQIAHGMGLDANRFASVARSEASVATGTAKPDGKPARIESSTKATASTGTTVKAGPTTAGVNTNAAIGANTKVGR